MAKEKKIKVIISQKNAAGYSCIKDKECCRSFVV